MGTIISSIVSAVLQTVLGWISAIFQKREYQQEGAEAQAQKETAATSVVEQRIADAEANAPRTDAAIEERLRNGTI